MWRTLRGAWWGRAERPKGLAWAEPALSVEGLQDGGLDALLLRLLWARALFFVNSFLPPSPQILRTWLEYFLTEGRVIRCPAL